ncbi:hypothetical protein RHMOL_Rhmol09G0186000 [Rhododendron molle]|uniref:Uncharacterized protein n=1 Tax=Rhododendron molle TaxID=49168 RepID=A0ACC0MGN1_RHOML|nr:hypothetical protein RHMOL_Rhmol09G0186000 [Rhododendron molle]
MDEESSSKQLKDIMQADSSLKRSDEDVALLDSYASIKSPLVISMGRNAHRKRARPARDEDSEDSGVVDLSCPQCGLGCNRAFCGAYWCAQSVTESNSNPVCGPETFKTISERTLTRIPSCAHENNRHEQDFRDMYLEVGYNFMEITSTFKSIAVYLTRMPLNHAEMMNAGTRICKVAPSLRKKEQSGAEKRTPPGMGVSERRLSGDGEAWGGVGEAIAMTNLFHFSCTGSGFQCQDIFYHQMRLRGKIAGTGFILSHLVLLSGGFVVNMPFLFNIHGSITKLDYSFLFVPGDLDQKRWRYSEPIGLEHTVSIVCATSKGA